MQEPPAKGPMTLFPVRQIHRVGPFETFYPTTSRYTVGNLNICPLTDDSSLLVPFISAIKDLPQESLRFYRFVHFTYVAVSLITSGWIGYRKRLHYPSPYLYGARAKPWPAAVCIYIALTTETDEFIAGCSIYESF